MDKDYFDFSQYKRVLKMANKPDKEEFRRVALITGVGAAFVGIIGTVITLIMSSGLI